MSTLSVGFLGLSHLHPRAYMVLFAAMPGMKVVAAAESENTVRESFAQDFPVRTYATWQQMLEQEKLDIAVLFLPHAHCPEAAVACAQRGIHLIVEKPMAADAAGVRRMIDAATKGRRAADHPLRLALPPGGPGHEEADRRRRHGPHRRLRRAAAPPAACIGTSTATPAGCSPAP